MTFHFIRRLPFCLLLAVFCGLTAGVSMAAEHETPRPDHCASQNPFTNSLSNQSQLSAIPTEDDNLYLSADNVLTTHAIVFDIDGSVSIQTGQQSIETDKAQYNRQRHRLTAQGNISYKGNSIFIESDSLDVDLKTNTGIANNTRYYLPEQGSNGVASKILFKDSEVKLEDSTYTTCTENKKAWQIRAKSIELHPQKNEGIARNMRLEIVDVPVLYLPYISFPLEGRKSGFLAPRPRYSSNDGIDIAIPYYFNLKPNYDLSLTPRLIKNRGTQMAAEFRYLQKKSSGTLAVEILPGDTQARTDRSLLSFNQQSQINKSTRYEVEYTQVSDKRYFANLGTELNTLNRANLSRVFRSETRGQNWLFNTTVQDYQMLDNNVEPYRLLPQLNLDTMGNIGLLHWQNTSQYSYFQKNAENYIHRAIVSPSLSMPLKRQYGYFVPTVGMRAALYQSSNATAATTPTDKTFVNWQFNSKTGLFFERSTATAYQTLSPELQYTYIPYKDQSQLPLIDTGSLNYDIDQLFTINRYSGNDRLGDENRLSWSVNTNYSQVNMANPLFSATVAQALYLSDYQIRIGSEKIIQKNDVVNAASIKAQLSSSISGKAQAYYFLGEKRVNNGNMSINYKHTNEQVEIGYRYRDQLVEQASVVGILNLSSKWRVASRWLYSLNSKRTREALLGLEYNSCCWAIRFMGRQYASPDSATLRTSVGLQIELKGLTRIGSSLDKQFSDEVFGTQ